MSCRRATPSGFTRRRSARAIIGASPSRPAQRAASRAPFSPGLMHAFYLDLFPFYRFFRPIFFFTSQALRRNACLRSPSIPFFSCCLTSLVQGHSQSPAAHVHQANDRVQSRPGRRSPIADLRPLNLGRSRHPAAARRLQPAGPDAPGLKHQHLPRLAASQCRWVPVRGSDPHHIRYRRQHTSLLRRPLRNSLSLSLISCGAPRAGEEEVGGDGVAA